MNANSCFSRELTIICALIVDAAEKGVLKKAVLSKPDDTSEKRSVITPRRISEKIMLQTEIFKTDNKAFHVNIALSDREKLGQICSGHKQINVMTTAGDCEYRISKSGKETVLGESRVRAKMAAPGVSELTPEGNDKEKNYILKGDEPFLVLLGVSDASGRIHDKKRSKFRQINRFLEQIRDILPALPESGTLHICDLCCGKSYLSFAVYHYFANILGRDVVMTGVDLKSDVIEYCESVARRLGFDGLSFICGDIMQYNTEKPPELVISLHACDTATDTVLEKASAWRAKVILSTPCCHHELNHTLNCAQLGFISEHSMLRQKFCDAATDALRLKLLEAKGYKCEALELIDPDETPKNILLRAVLSERQNPGAKERAMAEYRAARQFLLGR
ncbi:MAG: class I SAM-dependent methyltransferase [Eubacteriales bacterium]